jgi:hypothetical protein
LVDGGGADVSMVDLSENVPEVLQEKSSTSGPGSLSEQNSRLAEAILSASSRRQSETEAVKTQASTAVLVACITKCNFLCFLFSVVDPILTQRHYYEKYPEVLELSGRTENSKFYSCAATSLFSVAIV